MLGYVSALDVSPGDEVSVLRMYRIAEVNSQRENVMAM
jgi:hypothetical protein